MKKRVAIVLCIVAVLGAGTWYMLAGKKSVIQFKTAPVTLGSIRATVTATGTMNPVVTVNVGTQVSGTIRHIYANYNSVVKKGQIIAQIDPSTFQAQVDQARANLRQAEATVLSLTATAVNAKRTRDRNKELIAKELIAQADFDTSEALWLSAEAQVKAQEAQVGQMKGALDYAETNLRYTRILSPVDGTVVTRNVDVGQTVAASFQTPTLFYIAQDLTRMQIDTSVDEADIGRVKVGQEVDFNVDAYPDVLFKGKVSQVRISPITVQNVVTYDVVIQVENKELRLKPGMTANVSIVTAVKENILRLPNGALRFRPQEREARSAAQAPQSRKGQTVYILEEGKPKRVHVKTGVSDGVYTEIQSGGLVEGQAVIIESLAAKATSNGSSSLMPRARR
jgi:HlyD family secretion protein